MRRFGPGVVAAFAVATLGLAACGDDAPGSGASSPSTASPAGGVATVVRDALGRLNAWDLPGFCRYFAPEVLDDIQQLHGATGCDDPRLRLLMDTCHGCEKDNRIEALDVDIDGDHAVVHLRLRERKESPRVVTKDVRLERRSGEWKLLDSPEAIVS